MKRNLLLLLIISSFFLSAQVNEKTDTNNVKNTLLFEHQSDELLANIFPNPAKDLFFLEITNSGLSKEVEVNIYNFVGKNKFSEKTQVHFKKKYEVSTENLKKGIYIVEIKYSNKLIRKKLIIE